MTTHRLAHRLHPVLTWVLNGLEGTPLKQPLTDRLTELLAQTALEPAPDYRRALHAHLWMLDRAAGESLTLTAAGYLAPAHVKALAAELPEMADWQFSMTREVDVYPVLAFREHLLSAGLLRRYKGKLLPTRPGTAAFQNPELLWEHLADRLVPSGDDFTTAATVLVLAHWSTHREGHLDGTAIARALTELGWQHRDGSPVDPREVWPVANATWAVIGNVGQPRAPRSLDRIPSPEARLLIRDALFTPVSADGV